MFVKVMNWLLILVLLNGLLSDAYSRIGVSMESGGCNEALAESICRDTMVEDKRSNHGWRKLEKLGGNGPNEGTFKASHTEDEEEGLVGVKRGQQASNKKRSLVSKQRNVATNDYDLGPMHHPPKNN